MSKLFKRVHVSRGVWLSYLAKAATGKQVDPPEKRLKLLNGVKKEGNARRSPCTGLKHHKFNKIDLDRQGDYFDHQQPALITFPISDEIGDVLDWNGTDEYYAMTITIRGARGESCSEKVLKAAPSRVVSGAVTRGLHGPYAIIRLESLSSRINWILIHVNFDDKFEEVVEA